jgi:hypothetical protein
MKTIKAFFLFFLSASLLGLGGGCATLPKVSDAIDNASTQDPPQILSARGMLSPERSSPAPRRTCWNGTAPSSNR